MPVKALRHDLRRSHRAVAVLLLLWTATAAAQTTRVSGTVTDARSGEPLPFVSVQLVDVNGNMINGTSTDFDGYYAIAIPENGHELRFSYVGYNTQGATIHSGTMNQSLSAGAELSAVEVVRYKVPMIDKDGGASATTISRQDIRRMPAIGGQADLAQYMDVAPGVVNMRGSRSDAAYYVDGVKVATGGVHANYGNSAINLAAISFASDNVFSDGTEQQMASISGTTTNGYSASLVVGIAS